MRLQPTLVLVTVLTASALLASPAFAQSVELVEEDGGACDPVTENANHDVGGGCQLSFVSATNMQMYSHSGVSEVLLATCELELSAHVDWRGVGLINTNETTVHTNAPAGCPLTACEERAPNHAELEWNISRIMKVGPGQYRLGFSMCVRSILQEEGRGSTCRFKPRASQNTSIHVITLEATESPCSENPATEVSGTWQSTGASEIEIIDTHYPGDFGA